MMPKTSAAAMTASLGDVLPSMSALLLVVGKQITTSYGGGLGKISVCEFHDLFMSAFEKLKLLFRQQYIMIYIGLGYTLYTTLYTIEQ